MKNLFCSILILVILFISQISYSATVKTNNTVKKTNQLSIEEKKKEELEKNLKFWDETLKYGTISQKITVINYIKNQKVKEAENLIIKYYDDEDNLKVKKNMLTALISFSNKKAVSYLNDMFKIKEKNDDLKKFLITSISALKYKAGYSKILNYLNDKNIQLKRRTIRALGELGATEVIPTLITNFKTEENERLRTEYILAFAKLKSPEAEGILLSTFTNTDETELNRSYAATGLGYIQTKTALNVLLKYLPESKAAIRHRIAAALGYYKNKKVINALIKLLRDDDKGVRYYAIKSLEKLKAKSAVDALKYKKDYDPEFKIRRVSKEALKNITGKTNW